LTEQLLLFSRKQSPNFVLFDCNDLIQRLTENLRWEVPDSIKFITSLGMPMKTIRGDVSQIEQVIDHLMSNAITVSTDGGTILLETKLDVLNEDFATENSWAKAGEYVRLRIVDTGSGMTEEVKKRMFEPFYSSRDQADATGLGLAVSFGIVKQHKGFMNVNTELGIGTEIQVFLPVVS